MRSFRPESGKRVPQTRQRRDPTRIIPMSDVKVRPLPRLYVAARPITHPTHLPTCLRKCPLPLRPWSPLHLPCSRRRVLRRAEATR